MFTTAPMPEAADASNAERWQAVRTRDSQAAGRFVYAVVTTGVYCRPGCPSRQPRQDNVRFFDSGRDAAAAGFRPCKRCHPDTARPPAAARPPWLDAALEQLAAAPDDLHPDALARAAGVSRRQLDRAVKAATGLTPSALLRRQRHVRLQDGLRAAASATAGIMNAGFETLSTGYAHSRARLGMSPGRFRDGGAGEQLQFTEGETSLGRVVVAATPRGVCLIEFMDAGDDAASKVAARFPRAEINAADASLAEALRQVVALADGVVDALELPLDVRGTAFQEKVWQALFTLERGATLSYAELAERIGAPGAARAVAGACAANRLAMAIPCHRIITSDGGISGYRWGVARKRALLERERNG